MMNAHRKKKVRPFVVGVVALGITLTSYAAIMAAGLLKGRAATALIEVGMLPDSSATGKKNVNVLQEYKVYKATQAQLIKSPFVLTAALRKPEIAALEMVKRQSADPITWLQNNLKVSFPGDASIMEVSLADRNTAEAAKLVNAIVSAYVTEVVEHGRKAQQRKLADLDKVLSRKEQEIRKRRKALKRSVDELHHSMVSETLSRRTTVILQELALYQKELLRRQLRLVEAEVRHKAKRAMLAQTAKKETTDPKPAAPAQAKSEIRKQAELHSELEELKLQIAVLSAQVDFLKKGTEERREQAERLSRWTVELDMMQADLENFEAVRRKIVAKRKALKADLNNRPRIRVRQKAEATP